MPVSKKRKKEGKPVQRRGPSSAHEGGPDHPESKPAESKPGVQQLKTGKPRNPFVAQQPQVRGSQRGR